MRTEGAKRLLMISIPDHATEDYDDQVGKFRTKNLVAILRAVPLTDGTCSAVASKAREYGSTVLASALDEWIQEGREDLMAGDTDSALVSFTTYFDKRERRPDSKAGVNNASKSAASPRLRSPLRQTSA